jgi:hypothetical protein
MLPGRRNGFQDVRCFKGLADLSLPFSWSKALPLYLQVTKLAQANRGVSQLAAGPPTRPLISGRVQTGLPFGKLKAMGEVRSVVLLPSTSPTRSKY